MKTILSITLIPLFAGFSLPAFGYGGCAISGSCGGTNKRTSTNNDINRLKKELDTCKKAGSQNSKNVVDLGVVTQLANTQAVEIINLKKELEQKKDYGERMADIVHRQNQEVANLKKEVEQYKGDYLQVKADRDAIKGDHGKRVKVIEFLEGKLAKQSKNCPVGIEKKPSKPMICPSGYTLVQAQPGVSPCQKINIETSNPRIDARPHNAKKPEQPQPHIDYVGSKSVR